MASATRGCGKPLSQKLSQCTSLGRAICGSTCKSEEQDVTVRAGPGKAYPACNPHADRTSSALVVGAAPYRHHAAIRLSEPQTRYRRHNSR